MSGDKPVPIEAIPLPPVPIPGHPIPLRRNIEEWYRDKEMEFQVSLFIQAMIIFQEKEITNQLSYFQIAGIHGFPRVTWNGATDEKKKKEEQGFYCTHGLPTFPTWHRPYLALFERQIYNIMHEIIRNNYSAPDEKPTWEFSANNWRLPYWDWAQDTKVPELVRIPTVPIRISSTNEDMTLVTNPLNKFTMPGDLPMGDESLGPNRINFVDGLPFDLCHSTSRHGISWADPKRDWVHGVVKNDCVDATIAGHGWYNPNDKDEEPFLYTATVKEAVHRILNDQYFKSYEKFASTKYYKKDLKTSAQEFLSLEFIHNNLHNWIGGTEPLEGTKHTGWGHMCSVPVAAFDPIFYLHHCNVDRIFAIWQSINPDKWFDDPQYGDPAADTPLLPFRTKDPNVFYNSDKSSDVRYFDRMNYQYPETENKYPSVKNKKVQISYENYLPELTKTINELYFDKNAYRATTPDDGRDDGEDDEVDDFVINVKYNRYAFGGAPYRIRFFLKSKTSDAGYGRSLGSIYTFSTSFESNGEVHCQNCKDQADLKILSAGQIPIRNALYRIAIDGEINELRSTEPKDVQTYLQSHLHWKVVMLSGVEVASANVTGLTVSVAAGKVKKPKGNDQFIKFHDYKALVPATKGKVGGAGEDDIKYL